MGLMLTSALPQPATLAPQVGSAGSRDVSPGTSVSQPEQMLPQLRWLGRRMPRRLSAAASLSGRGAPRRWPGRTTTFSGVPSQPSPSHMAKLNRGARVGIEKIQTHVTAARRRRVDGGNDSSAPVQNLHGRRSLWIPRLLRW